ncbi:MAG: hypothetical protein R3F19_27675 [Verrucomicrobiales bacterium]
MKGASFGLFLGLMMSSSSSSNSSTSLGLAFAAGFAAFLARFALGSGFAAFTALFAAFLTVDFFAFEAFFVAAFLLAIVTGRFFHMKHFRQPAIIGGSGSLRAGIPTLNVQSRQGKTSCRKTRLNVLVINDAGDSLQEMASIYCVWWNSGDFKPARERMEIKDGTARKPG